MSEIKCMICSSIQGLAGDVCLPCLGQMKKRSPNLFPITTRFKYQPKDKVYTRFKGFLYFAEIVEYNPLSPYDRGRIKVKILGDNFKIEHPEHETEFGCSFKEILPTNSNQEVETLRYFLMDDKTTESIQVMANLIGDINIYPQFQKGDIILFAKQKCEIISVEKQEDLKQFGYGLCVISSMNREIPLIYVQNNPDEFTLIESKGQSL